MKGHYSSNDLRNLLKRLEQLDGIYQVCGTFDSADLEDIDICIWFENNGKGMKVFDDCGICGEIRDCEFRDDDEEIVKEDYGTIFIDSVHINNADEFTRVCQNLEMYFDKQAFATVAKHDTGFNKIGIHRVTKTKYDPEGYDHNGFDIDGEDHDGYDVNGFNTGGIHRDTGTKFNAEGYDIDGYNVDGFNNDGYNKDGFDNGGYDPWGFDRSGYDAAGYWHDGFSQHGINRHTGTKYDMSGHEQYDYSYYGGYDKNDFKIKTGIHRITGTKYDPDGFDKDGCNCFGLDRNGFIYIGGIHSLTGTIYDSSGYDRYGRNRDGFDRDGYDRNGFNRSGIHHKTGKKYDLSGFDYNGKNSKGLTKKLSIATTMRCPNCYGYNSIESYYSPKTKRMEMKICKVCNGKGHVQFFKNPEIRIRK